MSDDQRLPRRPYLLRAMHQWMSDAGMTPHVLVDTYLQGVDVPKAHVRDGRIVLNLSLMATRHLDLGNETISFEARFSGVPRVVRFPVAAVLSIYARESGEGLVFPPESDGPPTLGDSATIGSGSVDEPTQDPPTPPTPRRPSLKVVK